MKETLVRQLEMEVKRKEGAVTQHFYVIVQIQLYKL